MTPDYWDDAKAYLSRRDKTLKKIIASYEGEMLTHRGDAFYTLARSIAGQQISVKAADTVWGRLEQSVAIKPKAIAAADDAVLRAAGLSTQKVKYLRGMAEHFIANTRHIKRWPELPDDEVRKELVALNGIGHWTAEMFLIFHLARPDVFPVADIGLQKAIALHYTQGKRPSPAQMAKLGKGWQPYRTVATWYLWRALDPVPVAY